MLVGGDIDVIVCMVFSMVNYVFCLLVFKMSVVKLILIMDFMDMDLNKWD